MLTINQLRVLLASGALFYYHWLFRGSLWPAGLRAGQLELLALSGVLGVAISDLAYFHCLVAIGPRFGSLLISLAPGMAALLAWPVLGEPITLAMASGILVTLFGIFWVVSGRQHDAAWREPLPPRRRRIAVVAGLVAAAGQAGALVLAKVAMGDSVGGLSAALVRMVAGAVALLVYAAASGRLPGLCRGMADRRAIVVAGIASMLGPSLGVWLSYESVRLIEVGRASTLMATVPIFMLGVAWIAYGSRPTATAVLGTFIAVGGVAILCLA